MARSPARRRPARQVVNRNENRFFLYVIFYHMFTAIASLFRHD